jgi:hypothetical protein
MGNKREDGEITHLCPNDTRLCTFGLGQTEEIHPRKRNGVITIDYAVWNLLVSLGSQTWPTISSLVFNFLYTLQSIISVIFYFSIQGENAQFPPDL